MSLNSALSHNRRGIGSAIGRAVGTGAAMLLVLTTSFCQVAWAGAAWPNVDLEILEDRGRAWSIDQVTTAPLSGRFVSAGTSAPVFGFRDSAFWVRFIVPAEAPPGAVLEVNAWTLGEVDLFAPDGRGGFSVTRAGIDRAPHSRGIRGGSLVLDLEGREGAPQTYHLRVASEGSLRIPLRLWERSELAKHEKRLAFWHGVYLGLILALLASAVSLYVMAREPNSLLFALFITATGAFQLVDMGAMQHLLLPPDLAYSRSTILVLGNLALLFMLFFVDSVLGLKRNVPSAHRWVMVLAGALVVTLITIPVNPDILGMRVIRSISVITVLALIPVALLNWRRGHVPALFCLLGLTALLLGLLTTNLVIEGWLPYNSLTDDALIVGTVLEMVLLSIAFALRVNILKKERGEAESEAKRAIEAMNTQLERTVSERTEELAHAKTTLERLNAELRERNVNLTRAAMLDGLTGLLNYQTFTDQLAVKLEEARRYRHAVALILMDLDHFKSINDRYGHETGNQVLSAVGALLKEQSRESDVIARYGGEELAVFFPVYSGHDPEWIAVGFCQRARAALGDVAIEDAPDLKITASFGVAWCRGCENVDPTQLVTWADTALYAAKRAGRDRIEVLRPEAATPENSPDEPST